MAAKLTPWSWVVLKSTWDIYKIICIGRAIYKPEWDNCCTLKNESSSNINFEGSSVGRNGYAINIQWYTHKVVGVLEFVIDDNTPILQSNSDLVLVGFDEYMYQVHGSINRVPRRQTVWSHHMDDLGLFTESINLQTSEGYWYRRKFVNMWIMNTQVRDESFEK